MENLLRLDNICKDFKTDFWKPKKNVLKNISFCIPKGKITGFLGHNGAGKTTSIKLLMEFITPTSGKITYNSEFLSVKRVNRLYEIGYLTEQPFVYSYLSGIEYLEYVSKLYQLDQKLINQRIDYFGKKLEIFSALNFKTSSYSKGMLQRLNFLSILLHDPKFLILDEPMSGLDPIGRKIIKDLLLELKEEGKSIFFSSHIVGDVEDVASDVIVLDQGVKTYEGEIRTLKEKSSDKIEYQIEFFKDNYQTILAKENDKDQKISDLIKNGASIKRVAVNTKSLEEIIYKTERR